MPGFHIPNAIDHCTESSFRDDASYQGPSNLVETLRKYRFILELLEPLGSRTSGILLYLAKCTRPNIEFDEIAIHNGPDEIFRPGKQHWNPVDFTFYERLTDNKPYVNQAAQLIYEWWSKIMMDVGESLQKPPSQYLKKAQLDVLDGAGAPAWRYEMYDCWLQRVTPDELSYDETGIAQVSVRMRYSKCRELEVVG